MSVINSKIVFVILLFEQDDIMTPCKDIKSLMSGLDSTYKASDWRLYIDASLRAVLLHNVNLMSLVPGGYARLTTESYGVHVLTKNKYQENFKVTFYRTLWRTRKLTVGEKICD